MRCSIPAAGLAGLLCALPAAAQTASPAVFVTNDGNNEGAVTSFGFNPDGTLRQLDRVVIGTGSDPGTNATSIDVSADGRFLATGHATAFDPEQLTIISVAPDGSLAIAGEFLVPNAPLDLAWIDEQYLAVATTNYGGANNGVGIFRWDAVAGTLTEVDRVAFGTFTSNVLMDRTRRVLYAQDSPFSSGEVRGYQVGLDGRLEFINAESTAPNFPLGMGMTPDGTRLYSACGISGSGFDIVAFDVDPGGALSFDFRSPFISPGDSPKLIKVSADGQWAFAGHGRDATLRGFEIDDGGLLIPTGVTFDVGLQGSLGDAEIIGETIIVTDNTTAIDGISGVYAFRIEMDGSITQLGAIASSGGTQPDQIAVWPGGDSCRADVNGDGLLDFFDFLEFQNLFAAGDLRADFTGDGVLDFFDFLAFQNEFAAGCP
ncbi:MAG: GC-type dockerin domain-anchored protein [Phycisphaerales bacterium JB039]